MKIVLTPQAVTDIEKAVDYYRDIDHELRACFLDDIDAAIAQIMAFPKGSPPVEGFEDLRRTRMRQFPYGFFYQQTQISELLVVRVLHSRRHHPDALEG